MQSLQTKRSQPLPTPSHFLQRAESTLLVLTKTKRVAWFALGDMMHNGMHRGVHYGMHSGIHNGMHDGMHDGMHNGLHSGMHDGMHSGMHDGMHDGMHGGMHDGPVVEMGQDLGNTFPEMASQGKTTPLVLPSQEMGGEKTDHRDLILTTYSQDWSGEWF